MLLGTSAGSGKGVQDTSHQKRWTRSWYLGGRAYKR